MRTSLVLCAFLLAGCLPGAPDDEPKNDTASGEDTAEPEDLELAGTYQDFNGDAHEISNELWHTAHHDYTITRYDNDERWIVAQNDESRDNREWSRFDWSWHDEDGVYIFCQTSHDSETEQSAIDHAPADPDDFYEGCEGYPWMKLFPI